MENYIGKNIENYKIVSLLGKGGMGVVYKAYDTNLDRYVAIKMLNSQNVDNDRFIERFKKEAKNQAKLLHQNITTVYGFIEYENNFCIIMEYIDGESLEKIIYRKKRLSLLDSIYVIKNVLNGLGFAHSKGFIHRDIKPSNIIITKEGNVKIMDFGISKSINEKGMTKTGAKVGTLYYMSPEQVKGGELTIQSDIYSVGCTLFEMLVGEPPFFSDNDFDVMEGHLKKEEPKASKLIIGLPEQVDKIISIAMKKNPNERYRDCYEFIEALDNLEKNILKYHKPKPVKKTNPKKVRFYSTLGFSIFVFIIIALSYFIYNQLYEFINSDKLEELEKYNIQALFTQDANFNLKNIKKIELDTKAGINFVKFFGNTGILGTDSGKIYLSYDLGNNWISKTIDTNNSFNDAVILKNGKCFLVGKKPKILISSDYFVSYSSYNINNDITLFKIYFKDQNTGFVLGSKGTLLITKDGGNEWQKVSLPTNDILFDIDFINKDNGVIVGWNGLILKTTNGGLDWKKVSSNTTKYLKAVEFFNDKGVACGGMGEILLSDDGGDSWKMVKTGLTTSLSDIIFLDEDNLLAVGSKGSLVFSNNSGKSFKLSSVNNFVNFSRLYKNKNGNVFVCGLNGTLLKLN